MKEFGEGIDRICNELETKGFAIPTFRVDAFILKATLMAEWTSEKEFGHQTGDTINVQVNDTIKLSQLTERQCGIFDIIKSGTMDVPINASGFATMFNVSEKTIKRDLYVLRDLKLIKYVGSNFVVLSLILFLPIPF